MIKINTITTTLLFFLSVALWSCDYNEEILVSNEDELHAAIKSARPGDVILMENGVWSDVEIEFAGQGAKDSVIALKAREPGKVLIEGKSNLKIAGEYLEVSGLVFRNGHTPTSEVISFKIDEKVANHCRVTQCVIDDFNNPERFESDYWVAVYGKNNRFDHNTLLNKRNLGVTMAVRLNDDENLDNNHVIDYNYFGPRPVLGANGGETLRIGTSHHSLKYSNTIVRNNYFEGCDGEHEVISNKSCGNLYENNVFKECRGTLTMRHGNETLVKNNYFIGNRKPNCGGIRVINEKQTVINNYCYGLTGYRFRGALVIMNGVPDSPLNRYFQVVDSKIEGNVFVDCDHVQLCAGSDSERSAVPENTTISRNLFHTKNPAELFTVYDDISGISFDDNIVSASVTPPVDGGFKKADFMVAKNDEGLLAPPAELMKKIGFSSLELPVKRDESGASYYSKDTNDEAFGAGKEIKVAPGTNTMIEAYAKSHPGDILILENAGEYLLTKDFELVHPVTIKAKEGEKAVIRSEKSCFFRIENGGSLELVNLLIDGAASPDQAGNCVVSTSRYSMNHNYRLKVKNCDVQNLDVNHTFDFLKIYKNTFADMVLIENTQMRNISGSVLAMDKETEDLGIYNVEHVLISNCRFTDVAGTVLNIYRGGTDESTYGPILRVRQSQFENTGHGKRNKLQASVMLHGVQDAEIEDCTFTGSKPLKLHLTNGEPITTITDCQFVNTGKIQSNSESFTAENIQYKN